MLYLCKVGLQKKFIELFGNNAQTIETYFSPGRVNIMGEHIDYNGGLVLPAAISYGITAVYRSRTDKQVHVFATKYNQKYVFHLEQNIEPETTSNSWVNYILGACKVAMQHDKNCSGFEILLDSNLPTSSGLSSSASVTVLMLFILLHTNTSISRTQIALLAQKVEHDFINVQCGIMDQFAVANGSANSAMLLNCSKVTADYFPIDFRNYKLIIINSNRPRNLSESVYNTRKAECDEAFQQLSKTLNAPNLAAVRPIDIEKKLTDPILQKRALHVCTEQLRTRNAAIALRNKDVFTLGEFLNESHASLRNNYEVSSPELNTIVETAQSFETCAGARLTGAGFGGCCIALILDKDADKICEKIYSTYKTVHGLEPEFLDFVASDGVRKLG